MADNSTQGGSDLIRDKDRAGTKTPIVGIDMGIGTGTESLMAGFFPTTQYAATPVTTGVAANTASVTLIAANSTNRKNLMITNSRASSGILYVKSDGGTASIAQAGYSYALVPGQSYEYLTPPVTAVVGIWDSSTTGYANITEST
jgi:hypothetical protein